MSSARPARYLVRLRALSVFVEETLPAVMLIIMVSAVAFNVALRYMFGKPVAVVSELAIVLFIWQVFLGSAAAMRLGRHIGIEVLVDHLHGKYRLVHLVAVDVVMLIILLAATYLGGLFVISGSSKDLQLLKFSYDWVNLAFPVGLILMAGHVASRIYATARSRSRTVTQVRTVDAGDGL